jgi:hypothetical protein
MPGTRAANDIATPDALFDLDHWLTKPTTRVAHRQESSADPESLWAASQTVRLNDASVLGRLVRWRIPGLPPDLTYDSMFRRDPFTVLVDHTGRGLLSGMVGRLWTLRRDYPRLSEPDEFRQWSASGTARVLFANWVEPLPQGGAVLRSETRVHAIGTQGRIGMATLRPLVQAFQALIGSDGMAEAVRRAELAGADGGAP